MLLPGHRRESFDSLVLPTPSRSQFRARVKEEMASRHFWALPGCSRFGPRAGSLSSRPRAGQAQGRAGYESEVTGQETTLAPGGASALAAVGSREVEAGRSPTSRPNFQTLRAGQLRDLPSATTPGDSRPGGASPTPRRDCQDGGGQWACALHFTLGRRQQEAELRACLSPSLPVPSPAWPAVLREPGTARSPGLLQHHLQ